MLSISSLVKILQNSIMNTSIWWLFLIKRKKRRRIHRQTVELWLHRKWEGRDLWMPMESFKIGAPVLRTLIKLLTHQWAWWRTDNNKERSPINASTGCITFRTCNLIARWARILWPRLSKRSRLQRVISQLSFRTTLSRITNLHMRTKGTTCLFQGKIMDGRTPKASRTINASRASNLTRKPKEGRGTSTALNKKIWIGRD